MASILIVENKEQSISRGLQENENWEVISRSSLEEVLTLIECNAPHLIVINYSFAAEFVFDLLKKIRALAPDLPTVIVTKDDDQQATVKSLQLGVVGFIPESSGAYLLPDVISRLLKLAGQRPMQERVLEDCQSCQLHFVIDNDREKVNALVNYLKSLIELISNTSQLDLMRIAVALEEVLLNAIIHGNLEVSSKLRDGDGKAFTAAIEEKRRLSPYQDRHVRLQVHIESDMVRFDVQDEGPGFDVTSIPDPRDPEFLVRPHGRGLLLMKSFMDEVDFNATGNQVMLKKKLSCDPSSKQAE